MEVTITITQSDIQALRSLPISVSRVLKGAADLLEGDSTEIDHDGGVTASYLLALEPVLNRLFSQAKERVTNAQQ